MFGSSRVNMENLLFLRNSDSSVGIATSYGLDGRGSVPGKVPGVLSPGDKLSDRETLHSHPSSAEAKNGGAIPPLPHMSSWHSA
jgi:hypothetical protein